MTFAVMGKRLDFACQILADCLVPFIELALWARFKWFPPEDKPVNADSYYDAPEPERTREDYDYCANCESDQLHEFVKWQPHGGATAQCLTCGDMWDFDVEES